MKRLPFRSPAAAILLAAATASCSSPPAGATAGDISITVHAGRPGARINPAMWGIFFEDINFGADGGLHAELVKNRSFEFPDAMMGWSKSPADAQGVTLEIRDQDPFHAANPRHLRIASSGASPGGTSNEGFRGMGLRAGEPYVLSLQARVPEGAPALRIELADEGGRVLASGRIEGLGRAWEGRTIELTPIETASRGKLHVLLEGSGAADLDMVSLFPRRTWKDRPGGLRADLVQMLADMKPGFLRFPGGCIVEGSVLDRRYQWKTTIGPHAERKLIINRWNDQFRHRPAPDYFQSFGLGFFEYFQLAEDIGAEPLPIINCGMACQFNSGELVPLDRLGPFIQDALDLVEFANGPPSSPWGAKRAAMGHPEPFGMKMLGIGNEQWGPQYIERLAAFTRVLEAKYPEIALVTSAGPAPADDRFRFLWPKLRELEADIVDEHCYANPVWFLEAARRYDGYDRSGPKVFMGEYAAQSAGVARPENRNTLECALAEAAFMTGMERNADVVRMAAYAPLLAHVDAWQWTPNLIWADNLRVFGTPSYWVQRLFSRNRGDVMLPISVEGTAMAPSTAGRIGVGTFQSAAEFRDIRVTRGTHTLLLWDPSTSAAITTGAWTAADGALRQPEARGTAWAWAGDPSWTDYTLSLKARKLDGREGFLIAVRDAAGARVVWNLGGWGNAKHAIQSVVGGPDRVVVESPGSIETGRWYDLRIELEGAKVSCHLDGRLVHSAEVHGPRLERLHASAVRDEKAGEVIIKVVNPSGKPVAAAIALEGALPAAPARVTVLDGSGPDDQNSLDAPLRVSPAEERLGLTDATFRHAFKPWSLTVLRLPVKP
jgi:alpha-L-arabinofuranosidase